MKTIRKDYQGTMPENKILNSESVSQTDTYSCDYINNVTGDELPIGTRVEYNGTEIPDGWVEVEGGSSNVYSTEETIVGTYYDGKPIYRKCVIYNFDGTYKEDNYIFGGVHNSIGIGVIESLIRLDGFLYHADLDRIASLPISIKNDYGVIDYRNKGMDVIQVGVKSDYKTGAVIKITIEYTKTTD